MIKIKEFKIDTPAQQVPLHGRSFNIPKMPTCEMIIEINDYSQADHNNLNFILLKELFKTEGLPQDFLKTYYPEYFI